MKYLNKQGLAKVRQADSDRLDRLYRKKSSGLWVQSEKAGATEIYPVGGYKLYPVVDFKFTETLPEGIKGPENPSTITGVNFVNVTRCGKNLIRYPYPQDTFTNRGYTATSNSDGAVIFNGTSDGLGACHFLLASNSSYLLKGGVTYTANLAGTANNAVLFQGWNSAGKFVFSVMAGGNSRTFTPDDDTLITMRVSATTTAGTLTGATFYPQLELGTDATAFEPYEGIDYILPFSSACYGGTVDLATGVMTVTWKKIDVASFLPTSGITIETNCVRLSHAVAAQDAHYTLSYPQFFACEKFPTVEGAFSDAEGARATGAGNASSNGASFSILKSRLDVSGAVDPSNPTPAEWSAAGTAWLATNPLSYWVKLWTPFTVQLSPVQISALAQADKYMPRLNTLYTDQEALQVVYNKSPIRDYYEKQQSILALGGN